MLPQFLIKIFVKKRNLGYYREKRTNLSGLNMAEKSKKDLEIDSLRDKARAYKELRAHQAGGSESGGSCSWSAVSRVDETVKSTVWTIFFLSKSILSAKIWKVGVLPERIWKTPIFRWPI